ncbi:MAG: DNA polymerase III subunit beta [Anaerolineaceae bacterium]|jgi:DNA polymerase-3 subunit beta|nr:DNA polymerase III subunit beta [Anaerolineaceae bacterium]
MKVSVSQQQLAHGLGIVSRAVSSHSTLQVLSNILVATDEGRLRLSATNLELGISCWIGAQIEEEGAVTVPARTFNDLIATMPSDGVKLTLDERTQTLNVVCGSSNTDIKGIDAQEFPPMPVPNLENGIELNVADLKEMIQQVAFAASADDARPVLQGVFMTVEGSEITLAATDGFRISTRRAALSSPVAKSMSAIIPARALNELARVASDGKQTVHMVVPDGRGQVLFHLDDIELVSQLIDGNFPDYKAIIPQSFKTTTIVSTAAFLKACKQTEIIAREGNNVVRLSISAGEDGPGEIEISALSEETGSSEVQVDATVTGTDLIVAFNVRYLRELLDVVKSASVALETNASNTPGMLRPVGNEDFKHVIMPMHLG